MLTADAFKSLLSRFPTGVTVVTARDAEDRDHGITVSAFASVSLTPPLVLICIDHGAVMHRVIATAPTFAVNMLAANQETLSRRFADIDEGRFDGLTVTRGVTGCALLGGTVASIECAIRDRHAAGDHLIVIGEVVAGVVNDEGDGPLLYHRGLYARRAP